jgi:hypothetical protein
MAVRDARPFQGIPSRLSIVLLERCCELTGHITLAVKCAGARSAVNPHAACDAAGAGDGATESSNRARRGKPRTQPRSHLRATAPVPDPTGRHRAPCAAYQAACLCRSSAQGVMESARTGWPAPSGGRATGALRPSGCRADSASNPGRCADWRAPKRQLGR